MTSTTPLWDRVSTLTMAARGKRKRKKSFVMSSFIGGTAKPHRFTKEAVKCTLDARKISTNQRALASSSLWKPHQWSSDLLFRSHAMFIIPIRLHPTYASNLMALPHVRQIIDSVKHYIILRDVSSQDMESLTNSLPLNLTQTTSYLSSITSENWRSNTMSHKPMWAKNYLFPYVVILVSLRFNLKKTSSVRIDVKYSTDDRSDPISCQLALFHIMSLKDTPLFPGHESSTPMAFLLLACKMKWNIKRNFEFMQVKAPHHITRSLLYKLKIVVTL